MRESTVGPGPVAGPAGVGATKESTAVRGRRPRVYPLDPDLAGMAGLSFGAVRLVPFNLALVNAIASLATIGFRPPRGFLRKRFVIEGHGGGRVELLVYEPRGLVGARPCLLYFHGGAFMLRDFPHMHRSACEYARAIDGRVIFVRYRLAPRHPFPAGVEDCYRALVWAKENASTLGIDERRLGVGGDSAGGALAAAVALMARDRGGPRLAFQMLVYPVIDRRQKTESMRQFIDTPGWNARLNGEMWRLYLANGDGGTPSYAAPAEAETLVGLPPAYIETEEFDCLRDEGREFAQRLSASGVPVELNELRGTFHGFDVFAGTGIARAAVAARTAALRKWLG